MKVLYKETVVQWIVVDIPELQDLEGEYLEDASGKDVLRAIQKHGWDGQDVLENSFKNADD